MVSKEKKEHPSSDFVDGTFARTVIQQNYVNPSNIPDESEEMECDEPTMETTTTTTTTTTTAVPSQILWGVTTSDEIYYKDGRDGTWVQIEGRV